MKAMLIALSKGKFATVDDQDFEWLSQFKWSVVNNRYARRRVSRGDGEMIMMHRAIMDAPHGFEIDHINGDGLDNRRCNLRICTRAQNLQNQRPKRGGASQYKGVSWNKQHKKWQVHIRPSGMKLKNLGLYIQETAAARAYDQAAIKHFGQFARLNFPTEAQS